MENINKIKRWFFEKINKTNKFLARLIRGKKESPNNKNHKQKRGNYNQWQRYTKDHKRVPSTKQP